MQQTVTAYAPTHDERHQHRAQISGNRHNERANDWPTVE
jgi:hypothetical protein